MAQVINTNNLADPRSNISKTSLRCRLLSAPLFWSCVLTALKMTPRAVTIANRFTSNIKGLTARNINDSISLAQTG